MVSKIAWTALLLLAAVPALAEAANYCVAPNTGCGSRNVATLQQALGQADNETDADRIFLGAATYTAPSAAGFVYNAPGAPVEIIGAGAASTTLTAPSGAIRVVNLNGGSESLIRDLRVAMPANLPVRPVAVGLQIASPARNVAVVSDPTNTQPHHGVDIAAGGSLSGATVALSQTLETIGVMIFGSSGDALTDSTIAARTGVRVQDPGTSIRRVHVTSEGIAVLSLRLGVTVRSSILRPLLGGTGGLVDDPPRGFDAELTLDGVTIFGDGLSGGGSPTTGVFVRSDNGGQFADAILENSILRNVPRAIGISAGGIGSNAGAAVRYSDYDPAAVAIIDGPGAETVTPVPGQLEPGSNLNADPRFTQPPGDLSLTSGSPLIDRGDPAALSGFDFLGGPLIRDGDGDGTARRDMGACEYGGPSSRCGVSPRALPGGTGGAAADARPASINGFRAVPKRFAVVPRKSRSSALQRGTKFRWRLGEAASVTIAIARALPGRRVGGTCRRPRRSNEGKQRCTRYRAVGTLKAKGAAGAGFRAFTGRFGRRALSPGRYHATIGAVDRAGNISMPRTTRLAIVRPR